MILYYSIAGDSWAGEATTDVIFFICENPGSMSATSCFLMEIERQFSNFKTHLKSFFWGNLPIK